MDLDPSNPIAVILAFFGLMLTAFMFIIKFATMGLFGGLITSMIGIFGITAVWVTNFKGNR